jgi:predicted dehydrogenase
MTKTRNYALKAAGAREVAAPRLPYEPPAPRRYRPRIALVGCGGITASHLRAYRAAGWPVVAFHSRRPEAAEARRAEFHPEAATYTDYEALLARDDIDVLDIALPVEPRARYIEAALRSGKHVLSQKPFVHDLREGARLVRLAERRRLRLAVNQNGRWAPYVSWLRQAIAAGLIGDVQSVVIHLNWDHTWTKGTPFEKMRHLVLQDFGIHWFDMAAAFFAGRRARTVTASVAPAPQQDIRPPLLAHALVGFRSGTATLSFDGCSKFGASETIAVTGSAGTLRATGPVCAAHDLVLWTRRGVARPQLAGNWFDDGFRGAMGELLCAIEEDREPANNARDNLHSLALASAAARSADSGVPVRVLPPGPAGHGRRSSTTCNALDGATMPLP